MATSPIVMHEESANAPPSLSIIPFHEIRIITGTSNTSINERRLRHCVVRSARSNALKTSEVFGMVVCMIVVLFQ